MSLTAKLAYSQLKTNRSRSVWTLLGIALATAMITAVFGFAASGAATINDLIGDNDYYRDMYNATLSGVSAVFVSIIVVASVIVVSNAFRVSAGQRISQFGILKSVGATKRQILTSVLYEGIFLCVLGIPVGIVLGFLVNFIGVEIINYLMAGINSLNEGNEMVFKFVFAWQAVLLSIGVSFLTVLLSAWIPARRAAKIPAIDAIRGTGEVKIKARQVRTGRLVGWLFGFEGALASKSLKRSRRNFRATVVSLTVSVTMLIVAGSFGSLMISATEDFFPDVNATVGAQYSSPDFVVTMEDDDGNEITERKIALLGSGVAGEVAEKLREFPDTQVFGVGRGDNFYTTYVSKEMMTPRMREIFEEYDRYNPEKENIQDIQTSVAFIVTDADNYELLCRLAGVPVGSNILVNRYTHYLENGREVLSPYNIGEAGGRSPNFAYDKTGGQSPCATLNITNADASNRYEFDIALHGTLALSDIPGEVALFSTGGVNIIVPEFDVAAYFWFATPPSASKADFIEYAGGVLKETFPKEADSDVNVYVGVEDLEQVNDAMVGVGRLITVFVYGFVGMLTLIGLTNVISTISANVRSRAREFAMLRSVGMSDAGMRRMLNLESMLCSMRSLIFGVPLGIAGSYLTFLSTNMPVEISYEMPWFPIAQCVLGVFAITWVIMRYSASRLRGGSIIEAIRSSEAA